MIPADLPANEEGRLAALRALNILDTGPEERFDRITRLAQRMFGASAVAVTLIDSDRQWFKSNIGLADAEGPREEAFCAHTILGAEAMIVEDAVLDERFVDNPSVTGDPNVRFYAGHPVTAPGGEALGALCVLDDKPRSAEEFDREALGELAAMVEGEIAALTLAIGDELTGLSNRRGFEMLGERLLAAAERLELPVTAAYVDLDNMKTINDVHGHDAGDRALIELSRLLEAELRGSDLIGRLGGDEFCALLAGAESESAVTAVDRLQAAIAARNAASGEPFEVAASVGLAGLEPGAGPYVLADLVSAADAAMFEVKRARKGAGRESGANASSAAGG